MEEEKIWEMIRKNSAEDAQFIAKNILEYALALDHEESAEDMTVAVIGISPDKAEDAGIGFLSASYPLAAIKP